MRRRRDHKTETRLNKALVCQGATEQMTPRFYSENPFLLTKPTVQDRRNTVSEIKPASRPAVVWDSSPHHKKMI